MKHAQSIRVAIWRYGFQCTFLALLSLSFSTPSIAQLSVGQPDIAGIAIGMSYDEVIAVLSERRDLNQRQLYENTLLFQDANGTQKEIPDSAYRAALFVWNSTEVINVHFSPLDGKERVIGVSRGLHFPQGKEPLYSATVQAIKDKYGVPRQMPGGVDDYYFNFDVNGSPFDSPTKKDPYWCSTLGVRLAERPDQNSARMLWSMSGKREDGYGNTVINACAPTILHVNVLRAPGAPVAFHLSARLSGFKIDNIATRLADVRIKKFQDGAVASELEKAKQRIPDL